MNYEAEAIVLHHTIASAYEKANREAERERATDLQNDECNVSSLSLVYKWQECPVSKQTSKAGNKWKGQLTFFQVVPLAMAMANQLL